MKYIIASVALLLVFSLASCTQGARVHKHSYGSWEVQAQPTCTADGVLSRRCNCGHEEKQEVVALTHAYDSGITLEAPTCATRGLKRYTCKLCGETYEKVLDTVAHTVIEKYDVITEKTHAKQCMVCSKITKEEEHYFYGGRCVICDIPADSIIWE